ncbi:unnamed protein product [Bursaphelenchus okinawaensis]|uniref:Uncharacterized protein n=1 Tax=Bursaphelenchus okinawaensis TaxID=465554 RepID=A0A811LG45_9BILA|nr:unnamed protein product [Bursaphelenchus okinawaensis]CAG9121823.1 unnamed protein product [Bursaphelenchus okinawaensis]
MDVFLAIFVIFIGFLVEECVGFTYGDERCFEPLDVGPCTFFVKKWYYDQASKECRAFNYGGCLGTRNRFGSKQDCLKSCIYKMDDPVALPEICLLDADPGHCSDERTGQWWHYFNAELGICDKFMYYGCGGNNNRFYSLYQCRKVCGERMDPQIACERCDVRTSFCQAVNKYKYTCECREGYIKASNGDCIDMDECELMQADCGDNSRCINTIGSYKCECLENYVGNGKECKYVGPATVTDDCDNCNENAICRDGKCQCKLGFEGDGFNCTDVDECMGTMPRCDPNAKCFNTIGSYLCECSPGFAGNGFECTTNTMSCLDKPSRDYEASCTGEWREHFVFDHETKQCKMIWYDGCPSKSRNLYSDLSTCEEMCVQTHILKKAQAKMQ